MLTSRTHPFQELFNLQRALESNRRSDWLRSSTSGTGTFPPINIFRKDDDYVAVIELAGIDKSELDIQAKDNVIRLSGRKEVNYPEDLSTHRRERIFGNFDRTISVPVRIDADNIKAEYLDGILALSIPRAEDDKPRKVTIS